MCVHMNHMMLMLCDICCFSEVRMRSSHRYARLTGVPPKNEGMYALPPTVLSKARSSRTNRGEMSRDPRRSFDVNRRRTDLGRMSADVRETVKDDQRRDGSLGVSCLGEGMGESKEALRPRVLLIHPNTHPIHRDRDIRWEAHQISQVITHTLPSCLILPFTLHIHLIPCFHPHPSIKIQQTQT